MTAPSSALTALAVLLKSGLSLRQALHEWSLELTGAYREEARQIARRLDLGYSVKSAVGESSLARVLVPAFSVHISTGIDLVGWLERVAADIDERAMASKAARGAAAGAALSGRMVAGLPLLFVPLTPLTRAPLTDPAGLIMLTLGVVLAVSGLRWIGRLLPRVPEEDATAALCVVLSAMVRAGLPVVGALEVAVAQPDAHGSLVRAQRLVVLGALWPEALEAVGDPCAAIAVAIRRSQRFGIPMAEVLDGLTSARRADVMRAFEDKMKRAPVLMMVPLTCCILPAYALLALGPFLRSMSLG